MRKIILGIFLLSTWAMATNVATAQELKIGILYHDIAPVWGNTKIERGVDLNAEYIMGQNIVRANYGITLNLRGYTSRAYGGLVIVGDDYIVDSLRASLAVGVCLVWGYERKLGYPILFRVAGEIGYKWGANSISIILDHISNANLAKHNAGLDVIGVRYGYRF